MMSTPAKPAQDRKPAPPSRPFAEQRAGERGDHHRPEEIDRRRFGELQGLQRQEVEDRRAEEECAAQHVHRQVGGTEAPWLAPAAQQEEHNHDMHRKAHPDPKSGAMPASTMYFALVSRHEKNR